MTNPGSPEGYRVVTANAGVKLDANENPFGLVPEVRSELIARAAELDPSRYPDEHATRVRLGLSDYTGLAPEQLVVGNGSDELIQLVLLTFRNELTHVVLPTPTFGMYRVAASTAGLDVREAPLRDSFGLDAEGIIDEVSPTAAVVLCVPNNPTGNCFDDEAVEAVLSSEARLIIVDEAYYEFARRSRLGRVNADPRLVVMRTLSKAFGLAGLRVGYLAAHRDTAARIASVKPPYNVNAFSQLAASVVLQHRDAQLELVPRIMAERSHLYDHLREFRGLTVYPTEANFFLTRVDDTETGMDAQALWSRLRDRDISVRHYPGEPALANHLRVSVGTADENSLLLEALAALLRYRSSNEPSERG